MGQPTNRFWAGSLFATALCSSLLTYTVTGAVAPEQDEGYPVRVSPMTHESFSEALLTDTGAGDQRSAGENNGDSLLDLTVDSLFKVVSDEHAAIGLKTLMRYSDQDIERIGDPRKYAANLLNAVLQPELTSSSSVRHGIRFGTTVDEATVDQGAPFFQTNANMIYAEFSTRENSSPHVIVRWTHLDTRQVLVFEKQLVVPYADSTFVWFQQPQWQEGRYRVDVFAEQAELQPLASGSFQVYL